MRYFNPVITLERFIRTFVRTYIYIYTYIISYIHTYCVWGGGVTDRHHMKSILQFSQKPSLKVESNFIIEIKTQINNIFYSYYLLAYNF